MPQLVSPTSGGHSRCQPGTVTRQTAITTNRGRYNPQAWRVDGVLQAVPRVEREKWLLNFVLDLTIQQDMELGYAFYDTHDGRTPAQRPAADLCGAASASRRRRVKVAGRRIHSKTASMFSYAAALPLSLIHI